MDGRVGFGFRPTDSELAGYYLQAKLLGGACLVDETINEINIYSFDPWELRFQSKVKSMDPAWYFFSSSNPQTRKTSSGYWKITGPASNVEDQRGIWCARGIIGYKRVLVFKNGLIPRRGKSDWVMHEYHLTILPQIQKTHVICRVEYKGDDISFMYDNTAEFNPAFDQQVPNSTDSMITTLGQVSHFPFYDNDLPMFRETGFGEISEFGYDIEEINVSTYVQQNHNNNKPKDPKTLVFEGYSSDSDNDSTLFGDTASSVDSVGNPNELCFTPIPQLTSIDQPAIGKEESRQEYTNHKAEELKMELQEKEKIKSKWGWKMAEEDSCRKKTRVTKQTMEKKVYLKNMIKITAVISLCSIIAWITLLP